jgi:hypothetical protein
MDAKDRISAQQKILQMQLSHQDKQDALDVRREGLQIQAGIASGNQQDRKEWHEYLKRKDAAELAEKQRKADEDLMLHYDQLEIQAGKIKNEEARKKALANLKKRRSEAEDRMAGRVGATEDGQPDSKGRHVAKPGGTKAEQQTEAIKKALGSNYDPKKKYTVDKQGNIYEE